MGGYGLEVESGGLRGNTMGCWLVGLGQCLTTRPRTCTRGHRSSFGCVMARNGARTIEGLNQCDETPWASLVEGNKIKCGGGLPLHAAEPDCRVSSESMVGQYVRG